LTAQWRDLSLRHFPDVTMAAERSGWRGGSIGMSRDGIDLLTALDPACVGSIARALKAAWPGSATLHPAALGLGQSLDRHHAFIDAVQSLCDRGLMAHEALVIGTAGPVVHDAALTARGRALFQTIERIAA
jgi:hypothetical protein